MTIAYYITAHGFGHFVRAAAVIKELPAEIPLIVRTNIPEWFLSQELFGRQYKAAPDAFDCGTLGRDSTSVDTQMTFDRAAEMLKENESRLQDEVQFLKKNHVRVVVTDIPSFALRAAKEAGLPSLCITNFTWVEIYQGLVDRVRLDGEYDLAERGEKLVEQLRAEYALGDILLIPGMNLQMGACRRKIDVPIIARTGTARRELLCERLGLDAARPIYLLYLGRDGYEGMQWQRLREIPDAQFFSFTAIPEAGGAVHVLPPDLMDHSDATATADAVVGKLGYSLCAECAATLRPLIFPPRPEFVEAVALGKSMMDFGLGIPIKAEEFRKLNWGAALAQAKQKAKDAEPIDCSGAQVCAGILHIVWQQGTLRDL